MSWSIGESLNAEKLSNPYAEYRVTSAGQTVNNNTVTNVQFPTVVTAHAYVTPGGTNNSYFTLQPGLWIIHASYRAGGTVTDTRLYLFTGTTHTVSTTFEVNEGRTNIDIMGVRNVAAGSTVTIGVGVYQNSGTARTVDVFGQVPVVTFTRIAPR